MNMQSNGTDSEGEPELPPASKYAAAIAEEIRRLSDAETGLAGENCTAEAEHIQEIIKVVFSKIAQGKPTGWERPDPKKAESEEAERVERRSVERLDGAESDATADGGGPSALPGE